MKKSILFTIASLSLLGLIATAQAQPQGFSYQAVLRTDSGTAVKSRPVSMRIRLHPDSAGGAVAYGETFAPTTNRFGNVNLMIGRGTVLTGTFSALDWSHNMFMEVGVDLNGGSSFTDMGTTQLLSVPYALYAGSTSAPSISEIHDADNNTKVSTERNANENIIRFNLNGTEKMRLRGYALEFPNTSNSVYIGDSAGGATQVGAYSNVFVGAYAGQTNVSGQNNTFVGAGTGTKNTTSNNNSFIGAFAGSANTTGIENAFLGQSAGIANTTGRYNVFTGSASGATNTIGYENVFSGFSSGMNNTVGYYNTFTGANSGLGNTSGYYNTFNGNHAGFSNTTATQNTLIGGNAGRAHITGNGNTCLGYSAGGFDTVGSYNVYLGYLAGPYTSDNSKLYIANSSGTPLIWGDFAADSVRIWGGLSVQRSITATAFNVGSDRRLKENIQPVSNALANVSKINGVYYTYKAKAPDGNTYPAGRQIGVIAQDVEKVYPELVAIQPGGYKAVDYPKLTAVLIEAIKDLEKKNGALENKLAEISRKQERMESLLLSRLEKKENVNKVAKR